MSFLRSYLAYASKNEAPEMFHVWAAFAAISAVITRRVWLPYGRTAIYPNIYAMLVGDAGNGKSYALQEVRRILSEIPEIPLSSSIETPQGLCRYMAGDPISKPPVPGIGFPIRWPDGQLRDIHPITLVCNEFINFIGIDQIGWTNLLNDIYDEDKYRYRTKNMGDDVLVGPCVVLLGALTTDIAVDLQKTKIIASGFARRTIFQYGERKWDEPCAIPEFSDEDQAARNGCIEYLKSLMKLSGGFTWSDETKAFWRSWYAENNLSVRKHAPQVKSWYSSKPINVLKVAMLVSLSESHDLILSESHIQVALEYLAIMETDLYKVFGGSGRNELAGVAVKILEYISGLNAPVSYRSLKQTFFSSCRPPNDFDECWRHLVDTEQCEELVATIKGVTDKIIALPEVMSAFRERVKVSGPQAVAVPTELLEGELPSADPLNGLTLTQWNQKVADQAAARRSDGRENELPQLPPKPES